MNQGRLPLAAVAVVAGLVLASGSAPQGAGSERAPATAAVAPAASSAPSPASHVGAGGDSFRQAAEAMRGGDFPRATVLYREIAASGRESASLYWNWAQAAAARGSHGEALWAMLRAREVEPGDRAIPREIERLREASNLDPAELSPEPLAALGRIVRRLRLDLVAAALLLVSVLSHLLARSARTLRWPVAAGWSTALLGLAVALLPLAASYARPTGVVVRRGAPLVDSASPTAESIGALREGEVVPILTSSGEFVRVEDSSGARGWAHRADLWRLDRVPAPPE
jgi:hypothetical protein